MLRCKLCLKNEADKTNSHIISKFFGKRLFKGTKPRRLDKKGLGRKEQDTPKENYILCTICEKRLEHLETLISKKIHSINNYNKLIDKFIVKDIGPNKILECIDISPIGFKLFIYSLVWRSSISKLQVFENFNLDNKSENELRHFLDESLKENHNDLISSINGIKAFPKFNYCIFKPIENNENFRGVFSVYNMNPFEHSIYTVDYIIYFCSNEDYINPTLKSFSNFQDENVLIILTDIERWENFSRNVLMKMPKNKDTL